MDIGKWSFGLWPKDEESDGHWFTWGEWNIFGFRVHSFIRIGPFLIKRFG